MLTHVNQILETARRIPGEGFCELGRQNITDLVDATNRESDSNELISMIQHEDYEEDIDLEEEHVTSHETTSLTTNNLTKLMCLMTQVTEHISNIDPSFERREGKMQLC